MESRKNIALVAHDNRKRDLIEWVEWNWRVLDQPYFPAPNAYTDHLDRELPLVRATS